jgi:hypothetical protein
VLSEPISLFCRLFLTEARFHRRADACQQIFRSLRKPAIRLKLKIFPKRLGRPWRRNCLAVLSDGFFTDQVDALL